MALAGIRITGVLHNHSAFVFQKRLEEMKASAVGPISADAYWVIVIVLNAVAPVHKGQRKKNG